jgi:hypothetical protein
MLEDGAARLVAVAGGAELVARPSFVCAHAAPSYTTAGWLAELRPRTFCTFRGVVVTPADRLTSADGLQCPRGVERRQPAADNPDHDATIDTTYGSARLGSHNILQAQLQCAAHVLKVSKDSLGFSPILRAK